MYGIDDVLIIIACAVWWLWTIPNFLGSRFVELWKSILFIDWAIINCLNNNKQDV